MNYKHLFALLALSVFVSSCVSKKKFTGLKSKYDISQEELYRCGNVVDDINAELKACQDNVLRLQGRLETSGSTETLKDQQIADLKDQIADYRKQRDQQAEQVGDLTVLSKAANDNINQTLAQLENRDKYIRLLQATKNKTDSINLALQINLTKSLKDGAFDQDIDIKVDKTVVMINLSDKMLFNSGSSTINSQAMGVLGKIAKIIKERKDVEVMIEGYTDNLPISKPGILDNWDLSVKRATSVVRVMMDNFGINPDRMIAAGRGEFNAIADNSTADGRSKNRRTRIIIMPKLDQFYDLLNPENSPK